VVIGASTGGPAALLALLPRLPATLPAPVIIAQHMPALYTAQLARALAARSAVAVREAASGDALEPGVVYVAPGGRDLLVGRHGTLSLRPAPRFGDGCPSANHAMTSLAEHAPGPCLAVVLTGMGRDGAAGARAIKAAGGLVLAQDEASSLVWGMPRAAVETGCVDAVVALDDLADMIETSLVKLDAHRRSERHAS
jgi:two-component system chemotaxis response regulator CheB